MVYASLNPLVVEVVITTGLAEVVLTTVLATSSGVREAEEVAAT